MCGLQEWAENLERKPHALSEHEVTDLQQAVPVAVVQPKARKKKRKSRQTVVRSAAAATDICTDEKSCASSCDAAEIDGDETEADSVVITLSTSVVAEPTAA